MGSLLNKTLFAIPYELHLPGYQFCGPNTKLQERLNRGGKGINGLDEACREHDIAYSNSNDLKTRHIADRILVTKAMNRVKSGNSGIGEKLAALAVAGAMKAKVKVGLGLSNATQRQQQQQQQQRRLQSRGCIKLMNQCEKDLMKMKTIISDRLLKIAESKSGAQKNNNNNNRTEVKTKDKRRIIIIMLQIKRRKLYWKIK